LTGKVSLLLSVPLALQYEAVLTRPAELAANEATVERIELSLGASGRGLADPMPRSPCSIVSEKTHPREAAMNWGRTLVADHILALCRSRRPRPGRRPTDCGLGGRIRPSAAGADGRPALPLDEARRESSTGTWRSRRYGGRLPTPTGSNAGGRRAFMINSNSA
jgi:hypothetical protein